MFDYDLSFCIPSYNRRKVVEKLVKSILSVDDPRIEVVVLDNASTDGTYQELSLIKDPRLVLKCNEVNKGALFNMVNVLALASGQFAVYSTDQDHTNVGEIKAFKNFLLTHENISCGYCLFDNEIKDFPLLFEKGSETILNVAYLNRHPTGYFFNNKMLKKVDIVDKYSNQNMVGLFPLEFVFADLALLGNGAIYNRALFRPETGRRVVTHKSSTTNGKEKSAFFHPDSRLKLSINYSLHASKLGLDKIEIQKITQKLFLSGLTSSTIGYKKVIEDERLAEHYYFKARKINFLQLTKIAFSYFIGYVSATLELRRLFNESIITYGCRLFFSAVRLASFKIFKRIYLL